MKLQTWPDISMLTSGTQNVNHDTGSGNNFWTERAGEAIPTATLTFSTMPRT
jgi:hypothetical protein